MRTTEARTIERIAEGCRITLAFSAGPVDGVIENIQSILSNAYDERVQNDLTELAELKLLNA